MLRPPLAATLLCSAARTLQLLERWWMPEDLNAWRNTARAAPRAC